MEDKFKLMHLYKEHPQKALAMLTIRFHNKEKLTAGVSLRR